MGDPPPGVENGVGRCLKNDFCVDLEGVQLDLYHLKTWKQVVFLKEFQVVFGFFCII